MKPFVCLLVLFLSSASVQPNGPLHALLLLHPLAPPPGTYLMVWSQILMVQSELQEMKTCGWKGFHLTASTAMVWALYVSRNWLEYVLEH